jgi:hypothetical protein
METPDGIAAIAVVRKRQSNCINKCNKRIFLMEQQTEQSLQLL